MKKGLNINGRQKTLLAKEINIFGEAELICSQTLPPISVKRKCKSNADMYGMVVCEGLILDSHYDMPCWPTYSGEIPEKLVAFNKAMSYKDSHTAVHFYINDKEFHRIQTRPEFYLEKLKRFDAVIAPDFSQLVGMPNPIRKMNCFYNRAYGVYYHRNGIKVVPNITWTTPDSYGYSFCGIAKHSVIAVNCTGICGSPTSMYIWQKGYEEMIKRLEPSCILRYGDIMPNEYDEISVYYPNDNLNYLRNGR